jgi:hypothetical protein
MAGDTRPEIQLGAESALRFVDDEDVTMVASGAIPATAKARLQAVRRLGRRATERDALILATLDEDERVRAEAIHALHPAWARTPRLVRSVVRAGLRDPSARVRAWAMRALSRTLPSRIPRERLSPPRPVRYGPSGLPVSGSVTRPPPKPDPLKTDPLWTGKIRTGNVTVFSPRGEFDHALGVRMARVLEAVAAEPGPGVIVFDLEHMSEGDLTGRHPLLGRVGKVRRNVGLRVAFARPGRRMRRYVKAMELTELIPLFETVQEALEAYRE